MTRTQSKTRQFTDNERGFTLISMAFFVIVLGLLFLAGTYLFTVFTRTNNQTITDEKLAYIDNALEQFYAIHQRYPCPADPGAQFDTVAFGVEIDNECPTTIGIVNGTQGVQSTRDRDPDPITTDFGVIRIGAVPVRTLNIPDDYIYNGDKVRFIYAVTADYAIDNSDETTIPPTPQTPFLGENGAIFIQDLSLQDATSVAGNIVKTVISPGDDRNGTFDFAGNLLNPCDTTTASGENCDNDDTFTNDVEHSDVQNQVFATKMLYTAHSPICQNTNTSNVKNTAFLIDSSGSMGSDAGTGACPEPDLPADCKRMEVAHWAMRRVLASRIYGNSLINDPGITTLSGFVPIGDTDGDGDVDNDDFTVGAVEDIITIPNPTPPDPPGPFISGILFDNPNETGYTPPDLTTLAGTIDTELSSLCPSGITPLGVHLEALADQFQLEQFEPGSIEPDRPNKITVISDGLSNRGKTPLEAITSIRSKYGNDVEIDIISMIKNDEFAALAATDFNNDGTIGNDRVNYFETTSPAELLNALFNSAGVCNPPTPPPTGDSNLCGI